MNCLMNNIKQMTEESPLQIHEIIDRNGDYDESDVPNIADDVTIANDHDYSDCGPIDLQVRNVVAMFNCCCHVDLRKAAMSLCNVVYERNKGALVKQLKNPRCYIKIWSSGKVSLAGTSSEILAKKAGRRMARLLQKVIGPKVRFANYRITNVMATCHLPFGIRIDHLAKEYPAEAYYEPELATGLVWKSKSPKATLRIHTTGNLTITGAVCENDVLIVMENLYPVLLRFKTEKKIPPANGLL